MELKYDVFISYSHCDRKVSGPNADTSKSRGLRCFIDYRDIPGAPYGPNHTSGPCAPALVVVAGRVPSDDYNRSVQVEREARHCHNSGSPYSPSASATTPSAAQVVLISDPQLARRLPDREDVRRPRRHHSRHSCQGWRTPAGRPIPTSLRRRLRSYRRTSRPSAPMPMPTKNDYEDGIAQMVKMNLRAPVPPSCS